MELNCTSYAGNVKEKTDEQNIVEKESMCLGDWMNIEKAEAGKKKVNDRFGIKILGGLEL